jgi:ATP-dependent RNA helicase HelY
MGRSSARSLLEASFAQFQTDRAVAGLVAQIRRNDATIAEERERMACDRGDFAEYFELRRRIGERESTLAREGARARRGAVAASLEALRRGDVIRVPSGRRAGLAVVIDPGVDPLADPHPLVVTEGRWAGRLSMTDFPVAVEVLGSVRVPKRLNHRSPQERRDLASSLRALDLPEEEPRRRSRGTSEAADDETLLALRAALRTHPCHACPDREDHARWAERANRLDRENDGLRRRVEGRTGSLGRGFDAICALLEDRGFLAGDETTSAGRQLARIWSDADLLTAECLRAGIWDALAPAELAAVVSTLVYEPRREEQVTDRMPTEAVRLAVAETTRIWSDLAEDETARGLPASRAPELGFVWATYRWAKGERLDRVLEAASRSGVEATAGDFVRWSKQILDLLEQLVVVPAGAGATVGPISAPARAAVTAVRRGVVAQSMQQP